MTRHREVPEAIQWREGMMLAPQHFQQLTLRQEALLGYHIRAAAPYHWGIRHAVHNPALLADGVFRIDELAAVMPDGLLVEHLREDEPLELNLAPHAGAMSAGPLTIHLAVAVRRTGGGNVAERQQRPDAAERLQRYREVAGQAVADEVTGALDEHVPIDRFRPLPQLLPVRPGEAPPDQRYVAFPLAKVTRSRETFVLTGYQPPALALAPASPVGARCVHLSKEIRDRVVGLIGRMHSPSLPSGSDSLRHMASLLRSLVPALPPFEAVLNSADPHPFTVYLALTALAGQVATLGTAAVPPLFAAYDHNDIQRSFQPAFDFLSGMLKQVQETYTVHPFIYENGRYALLLEQAFLARTLTIGVSAPADGGAPADGRAATGGRGADDVAAWIGEALIGSAGTLDDLWNRRVLGAGRQQIDSDPAIGVLPSPGEVLFSIAVDPEIIQADKPLVIWNVGGDRAGRRPSGIRLYVGIAAPAAAGAGQDAPPSVLPSASRPVP